MNDGIDALRRFSRLYTREVGALGPLPGGDLPLTEARVLFELASRDGATAGELGRELGLDAGHLSRILTRFGERGWLLRERDAADARRQPLRLTGTGREAFAGLDQAARERMAALLGTLPDEGRARLVEAVTGVSGLLDRAAPASPILIRHHRPGDLGWVVQRHGAIYAAEYGFDGRFEALVARVAADFLDGHDPAREVALIAERDELRLGSVMVVRVSDEVAKLRLLILEPAARGQGLGKRLVREAEAFARAAGYRRMVLWTQSCLVAARGIYAGCGWRLVEATPNEAFGQALVSESWERDL
jgi:DNA-binding MarR family transcriptional regulator/GNAT superfamily N-acetyltransferase